MKNKWIKQWLMGILAVFMLTFTAGAVSSYSGYTDAKQACVDNEGTVQEDSIDMLAFHWSVSCEK